MSTTVLEIIVVILIVAIIAYWVLSNRSSGDTAVTRQGSPQAPGFNEPPAGFTSTAGVGAVPDQRSQETVPTGEVQPSGTVIGTETVAPDTAPQSQPPATAPSQPEQAPSPGSSTSQAQPEPYSPPPSHYAQAAAAESVPSQSATPLGDRTSATEPEPAPADPAPAGPLVQDPSAGEAEVVPPPPTIPPPDDEATTR